MKERRSFDRTYLIDADGEEEAARLDGEIVDEADDYSIGEEVLSVDIADGEEVA